MSPLPLRADFNAQTTRSACQAVEDGPQARRLLALATIYDGATRTEQPGSAEWVCKLFATG